MRIALGIISLIAFFSLTTISSYGQFYDNSSEIDIDKNDSTIIQGDLQVLSKDFFLYTDKEIGFQILYPEDWEIDTDNSQHYTVVRFNLPDYDVSVDVRIFPQGNYKSIKDYGNKVIKQNKDITLLAYYRNSTTVLGNQSAFKAVYLTTFNPSIFEDAFGYTSATSKALMTATLVNEKKSIFAIGYFSPSSSFADYLPTVQKMINSFKFIKAGPVIQED